MNKQPSEQDRKNRDAARRGGRAPEQDTHGRDDPYGGEGAQHGGGAKGDENEPQDRASRR